MDVSASGEAPMTSTSNSAMKIRRILAIFLGIRPDLIQPIYRQWNFLRVVHPRRMLSSQHHIGSARSSLETCCFGTGRSVLPISITALLRLKSFRTRSIESADSLLDVDFGK